MMVKREEPCRARSASHGTSNAILNFQRQSGHRINKRTDGHRYFVAGVEAQEIEQKTVDRLSVVLS